MDVDQRKLIVLRKLFNLLLDGFCRDLTFHFCEVPRCWSLFASVLAWPSPSNKDTATQHNSQETSYHKLASAISA
ncbi:uncharacterized protein LOC109490178 isoform X6 [Ailuropoda melanoleuca]|uniref:uncharacterized protein LOC109490178 isoform X6 n=1 Tax=Ailuropoda melanoleuca TaxID=9646 RepID=UPI001494BC65|nr:uncharacterized protein LOC109490178 isoform X6 [Ailuropoda melanoleuca]